MVTSAVVSALAIMGPLVSQAPAAANPIGCRGEAFETTVTDRGYFESPTDAGTRLGTLSAGSIVCAQGGAAPGRYYNLYQEHSNLWRKVTLSNGQGPVHIPAVYMTEWDDDDLAPPF